MFDPAAQSKMMKAYSDASLGYTNAAFAAANAWTDQALKFWGVSSAPASTNTHTRTTRATRNGATTSGIPNPWDPQIWMAMNPWAAAFKTLSVANPTPGTFNPFMPFHQPTQTSPFDAWLSWWTNAPRYTANTWPMALAMMSSGMPHAVAWPLADANRAMIDATETATNALNETFSTYRSDSGHAVAQIRFADTPQTAQAMMAAPFMAAPMMLALALGPITAAHQATPWLTMTLSLGMPENRT